MVRFLASILLGIAITFGLFSFMAFLVSSGDRNKEEKLENIVVEVNTTPPKSAAEQRRRVPPPPPPPPKTPPKPQAPEPETNTNTGGVSFSLPNVNLGGASTSISAPGAFGRDGDATPIVRIEPKYPMQAARDGKEGWVKLSFTIDEIGGVTDVEVIDADPKRVFDKEARRALRKWKYKPKVVDGKPQRQTGLTVQLDFKMNQD
ncbi:energy transducer TonB [Thalassotalea profundi]|uniref:Protein TonB n=1 Tax=Thalassotalea profundi TaxID=2036687 RepID=A0ABQ3J2L8_9GAMM|nr:energy transducer TonB [Thalassotalea profundi]GHE98354.1 protein TonB [Thalassotalea profundi]